MPKNRYSHFVVVEWRNGPVVVELVESNKHITLERLLAHYEREGADWERDSITLVNPPATVDLDSDNYEKDNENADNDEKSI